MRMATSPSPARAESLNYNSSTDLTAENWKFTIAKAVSACTAPTAITALAYTGDAQTLINAGTTADGTMQYSTDGTNYGTTISTGENAGEYTVWYKVAGDSNHSDTTPESVGVTIAKAKVEIPAADPTQFTYSGEEQTYTLAASGLYTVAGNVRKSAGTYTVTVTLKDAENYVWSDNMATAKTFDFAIAKAPVTVIVKDKSAYIYDAAPDLSKPELDKDYTVSGLIGEDKLTTAPTLAYDPATPDMTSTGDAAKIVVSGASAGENYEITYVDGKLTVTSRPFSGGGGHRPRGRYRGDRQKLPAHRGRHSAHHGRRRDCEDHGQLQGFHRHSRPLGQGRHRLCQRPWAGQRHERHDLRAQQLHHPGAALDDPRAAE